MYVSSQFIVDFHKQKNCASESVALDWSVFDNDCRRYLDTHLEQNIGELSEGGVQDEEQDIRCDDGFFKTGVDVQHLRMLTVKRWVDNGETIFEMR
jgi:hypothetical protein